MRWAGHVARMRGRKSAYMVSVVRPDRKKPLARYVSRWEDNIKVDFQEVDWGGMDCIALAWNRDRWRGLVNAITFGFHKIRGIS